MENISVDLKEMRYQIFKNKTTLAFDIKVDGKVFKCSCKKSTKSPITSDLLHVDLMVAQKRC